jgi:hypothetical protein
VENGDNLREIFLPHGNFWENRRKYINALLVWIRHKFMAAEIFRKEYSLQFASVFP